MTSRAFTRDLETEGHVMVDVTFVIYACICPTVMIFFSGFQVKEFVLTIATCVTIRCDIETQGHVMVYVTQQPDKTKRRVDHGVTFSFQGHT